MILVGLVGILLIIPLKVVKNVVKKLMLSIIFNIKEIYNLLYKWMIMFLQWMVVLSYNPNLLSQ
jgi:hypothetical protein